MGLVDVDDKELSPAARLTGRVLESGWTIQSRLERLDGQTGASFSIGYLAINDDREIAFLKALDFSRALEEDDIFKALDKAISEYRFEEELLILCAKKRMSKVVRTLDSGYIRVDESSLGRVPYLLFEPAEGDIRKAIVSYGEIDLSWALSLLHEVAVGLQQLHYAQIAHQDLKPSNVLTFQAGRGFKLSDLGCASRKDQACPRDQKRVAGGWSVTSPELQYGELSDDWLIRRIACDLYSLGSLAVFLFSGASMNAVVRQYIPDGKDYIVWRGTYREVLPFVKDAYDQAFHALRLSFQGKIAEDVFQIIRELCDPDPYVRGTPGAKAAWERYSVEKYVSRLGNLRRKAEYAARQLLRK